MRAQEYLQDYGIKPSLQRIAIVDFLMENRIHPTADDIYNALYIKVPTLSKTTVYNTLKLFADQGAVTSLVIDEKHVRYDIDISQHAHFQCCNCHKVFDIPIVNSPLLQLKEWGELTITESHLYYKGFCLNCNNNNIN